MRTKGIVAASLTLLVCSPVWAAIYEIDQAHSSVSFKIKHMLSKTQGTFNKFSGTIGYEAGKPESWSASGVIEAGSVDTNNEKRDAHLKSADFFDTEKNPTIEFHSTGVKEATDTTAKMEGVLKMHGVEKPVTLSVEILGVGNDPWGNTRAAFTATTKINRKEFGIEWNQTLDQGGLLLGEDVDVTIEIEAMQNGSTSSPSS